MHKAILSKNERKIIQHYLDTGEKLSGFRVLKHRIIKNESTINTDFDLLTKLKTSVDETKLRMSK